MCVYLSVRALGQESGKKVSGTAGPEEALTDQVSVDAGTSRQEVGRLQAQLMLQWALPPGPGQRGRVCF